MFQPRSVLRRRARRFGLASLAVLALGARPLFSQTPPKATLRDLGIRVESAKVTSEIKGLMGNKLGASAGNKLVVAKLSGETKGPVRLDLAPTDFSAAYGSGKPSGDRATAGALGIDGMWLFAEGVTYAQEISFPKAGPVVLEVAISVPEGTTEFEVRYRGESIGKAALSESKGAASPAPGPHPPAIAISAERVDSLTMSRTRTWTPAADRIGVLLMIRLAAGEHSTEHFSLDATPGPPPASPRGSPSRPPRSPCLGYQTGGGWAVTDGSGKGWSLFTGNPQTDITFLFEVPAQSTHVTLVHKGRPVGEAVPLPAVAK